MSDEAVAFVQEFKQYTTGCESLGRNGIPIKMSVSSLELYPQSQYPIADTSIVYHGKICEASYKDIVKTEC